MSGRKARAAALAALAAAGTLVAPCAAQARPAPGHTPAERTVRSTPSAVAGVGELILDEPNTVGHPVWFAITATKTGGAARGRFWFRHLLPDGTVVGEGWADVTCLQVTGNVALLTAVVPEGVGNVQNHGFYLKIADGGTRPDQVTFVQAQNGSERPPAECKDVDAEFPGTPRYPIVAGGYIVRAGS